MENKKESLIEENSNQTGERSDSFIRRTTFIPTPESENDQDIKLLKEMGFDEGMVKKVYLVLRPRNLSEAIEMMSEQNGMYQHDFIESRASSNMEQCYICKKERRFHRDYDRNRDSYLNILNKNKEIALVDKEQVALEEGEKGLCAICLEDTNEGNRLQCGHFCCDNCMYNYLKTEIESAKVAKLQCFIKDCDYVLNEDFILSQLRGNKILIDKYKVFKQRAEIFLSKDKKFCPEPDCNSYLQQSKDKYVQCENGHKYCYICLKKWHGKSPCDEELDKDFQIWKKDKVVKQCPRCKIYTEKNEGCNHMTCTECKYQWCWLCEGEYQEGHFRRGTCNGLQFAKINFLSEKDTIVVKNNIPASYRPYYDGYIIRDGYIGERHYDENQRHFGCCICNDNIKDKLWFFQQFFPYGYYYGNRFLMYILSLSIVMFFLVPVLTINIIYETIEDRIFLRRPIMRIIIFLYTLTMFIRYQLILSCLVITGSILTIPFPKINVFKFSWDELNDSDEMNGFVYY